MNEIKEKRKEQLLVKMPIIYFSKGKEYRSELAFPEVDVTIKSNPKDRRKINRPKTPQ